MLPKLSSGCSIRHGLPIYQEASINLQNSSETFIVNRLDGYGNTVQLVKLDAEIERLYYLDINASFIKIDVEDAEVAVLRAAAQMIDRCCPILHIEKIACC